MHRLDRRTGVVQVAAAGFAACVFVWKGEGGEGPPSSPPQVLASMLVWFCIVQLAPVTRDAVIRLWFVSAVCLSRRAGPGGLWNICHLAVLHFSTSCLCAMRLVSGRVCCCPSYYCPWAWDWLCWSCPWLQQDVCLGGCGLFCVRGALPALLPVKCTPPDRHHQLPTEHNTTYSTLRNLLLIRPSGFASCLQS